MVEAVLGWHVQSSAVPSNCIAENNSDVSFVREHDSATWWFVVHNAGSLHETAESETHDEERHVLLPTRTDGLFMEQFRLPPNTTTTEDPAARLHS